MEIRKVLVDKRGEIYEVLHNDKKYAAIIFSRKGAPRGAHYHTKDMTHMILFGSFLLREMEQSNPTEFKERIVTEGNIVNAKSGLIHMLRALEDSAFIELGDMPSINFPPWRKEVEDYLKSSLPE